MKSARINFGIPDSEYILEVDDSGAATSLVNQDTDTEYVGGGGGSDLTIAHLHIINSTNDYYPLNIPITSEGASVPQWNVMDNSDEILNVILYEGLAISYFNDGGLRPAISGNIRFEEGMYIISGDCSMTIS